MLAIALWPASVAAARSSEFCSISSEWSQRTAMITFALVPRRTRVLAAKLARER